VAVIQINMQFVATGDDQGNWSEIWYVNQPSIDDAIALQPNIVPARIAFLHPACELRKIRYRDIDEIRVADERIINAQGQWPAARDPSTTPPNQWVPANDQVDTAMIYQVVTSAPPGRRKVWFRGIAEDAHFRTSSNSGLPSPAFDNAVKNFFRVLNDSNAIILVRFNELEPGYEKYSITKIDGTMSGQTLLTIPDTSDFQNGYKITVHQTSPKDYPGLNSTFEIRVVDGTHLAIRYVVPNLGESLDGLWGYLRRLDYRDDTPIDVTNSVFDNVGSHQSRRPYIPSRGARRSDRRLRLSP
jgi:hypothetical protein